MLDGLKIQLNATGKEKPTESNLGFGRFFTDHMFIMNYSVDKGWHDFQIRPYGPLSLDPAAAVLHYGQSLFEGLKAFRMENGRVAVFRVDRHCKRMAGSTSRLCMPELDPDLMRHAILKYVEVEQSWVPKSPGTALYLRPTLIATEPFLGVRSSRTYSFFIISCPVGAYYEEGLNPVKIWVEDRYVRAVAGGLGAVKAGANYAASLLASEKAKSEGYAQVLWLDGVQHRYLEEVGTMNLFIRLRDELITPPLEGSILGGITRESVLTLAADWGLKVNERRLRWDEVVQAQKTGELCEVFGTGTAAVISPVGEFGYSGGRLVINNGQIGEWSQKFYDAITGVQYGRLPDRFGWLTEIK